MGNVRFEDYHIEVENAIKEKSIAFLYTAVGEIMSQAQRNSRIKSSQTAGSFKTVVDEQSLTGYVGSDYWNAIYEEFGTGEHATNGDGRKGYWVFVETSEGPKAPKGGKSYTKEEAKRIMRYLRDKGLNAYYTNGKTANRPLWKAFTSMQSSIEQLAAEMFGGLGK